MTDSPSSVFDSVFEELKGLDRDASLFLLSTESAGFFLFSADRMSRFEADSQQIEQLRRRLDRARGGRPILSSEPAFVRTVLAGNDHANVALLPIIVEGSLIGSLNVAIPEQSSAEEMDAFRTCADRIGDAVRTSLPSDSVERRNLQLNLITRLGRQDVWDMDFEAFFDMAVVSIREGLRYYNVSIFTLSDDQSELTLAAHAGAYRGRVSRGYRQNIGVGMLGWVVRHARLLLANDVSKEPNYAAVAGLATLSEICLPIIVDGRVEGVLNVESDRLSAFDDGDVVALEALAQQIADFVNTRQQQTAFESLKAEREDRYRFGDLLGRSPEMRRVFELVRTVAGSVMSVLIKGETGTGKELVAKAIHRESDRRSHPFIAVNCAALPEALFESELFGHERGAFTGADRRRVGKMELADGGTLFLDEVGEIPHAMQAKLLRAIEEKTFTRVGGEREIKVDVRILSATNLDQADLARGDLFRQDLYFRLCGVAIDLPPLRTRIDDIPLLAAHFLREGCERAGKSIESIDPRVLSILMSYSWPGNVRELENVMGRAVLMEKTKLLQDVDLPPEVGADQEVGSFSEDTLDLTLKDACRLAVAGVEKEYIRSLLARTRGNVSQAAKQAGVTRRTLYNKLAFYGLKREDFVASG